MLSDIDDGTVIGITEKVTAQAAALLEQFPLRTADPLHIARLGVDDDLFVSADDRQCKAASPERNPVAPRMDPAD